MQARGDIWHLTPNPSPERRGRRNRGQIALALIFRASPVSAKEAGFAGQTMRVMGN